MLNSGIFPNCYWFWLRLNYCECRTIYLRLRSNRHKPFGALCPQETPLVSARSAARRYRRYPRSRKMGRSDIMHKKPSTDEPPGESSAGKYRSSSPVSLSINYFPSKSFGITSSLTENSRQIISTNCFTAAFCLRYNFSRLICDKIRHIISSSRNYYQIQIRSTLD